MQQLIIRGDPITIRELTSFLVELLDAGGGVYTRTDGSLTVFDFRAELALSRLQAQLEDDIRTQVLREFDGS